MTTTKYKAPTEEVEAWRRAAQILLAYYRAMQKTKRERDRVCVQKIGKAPVPYSHRHRWRAFLASTARATTPQ